MNSKLKNFANAFPAVLILLAIAFWLVVSHQSTEENLAENRVEEKRVIDANSGEDFTARNASPNPANETAESRNDSGPSSSPPEFPERNQDVATAKSREGVGKENQAESTPFYVRPPSRSDDTGHRPAPRILSSEPSNKDALEIALEHLRSNDAEQFAEEDVSDVVVKDRYVSSHNGVTHLYLRQRFDGIEVYNGDSNVNLTADGRIINANSRFVSNLAREIQPVDDVLSAEEALKRAAVQLALEVPEEIEIKEPSQGRDRRIVFDGSGISLDPITAKLMYLPVAGKQTRMVWNAALRLPDQKRWLDLNLDAEDGTILSQANWIADSGYRVFPLPMESPNSGGRTLETDPSDPTASPHGWHDIDGVAGAEFTDTRGNNVDAQEDADANNTGGFRPDGGAGRNFDFPLDLSGQPETYQPASITNLFYWNNILHDIHYHYGFDESAGNFQRNNYGKGGVDEDQVKADLLDGSGFNNANFATPPDGMTPRMQMFVWSGPAGELTVNSPAPVAGTYSLSGATFGADLDSALSGNLVLANDGSANPTRACRPLTNGAEMAGNIALVDRGGCSFPDKAYYSQMAGARAVIIVNNVPGGGTFRMGGWDPYILIPVFMVSYEDGQLLKDQLGTSAVNVSLPPRINRDSALDNGVIIHEYGHGVSNRLTGGPSNSSALSAPQSRGMGEGWSDWWGLVLTARPSDTATTSRGIGTYLLGQDLSGRGIRPAPYTTDMGVNSLTYGDVANPALSIPHGIGTIWCTALWEVYWALVTAHGYDPDLYGGSGGNNIALQLVMDGLKLQPANPSYLDARDAILLADELNNGGANTDLLWGAFAKRGMGISAFDGGSASALDVRESFDTPNSLTVTPGPNYIYESAHLSGRSSYSGHQLYTLQNTGLAPLNWTATAPSNWLDLDVESGSLSPGQSVTVTAYLTSQLRNIGSGTFFDTVTFTNTTDGVVQERRAHMTISNVPYAYDNPFTTVLMSDPAWYWDDTISMDGESSARSGEIGDNESSWMEAEVNGPGTLSFFWKVSSERGYDFLNLFLDDALVQSISGEVNWTKVALEIPDGSHTVRWEYSKDFSLDGGEDAAWVDLMDREFGTLPVITSNLTAAGLVGRPFSYQIEATYSPDSFAAEALPPGLTVNPDTGLISGTPSTAGSFDVLIAAQNSQGSSDRDSDTTLTIGISEVAPFPFSDNFESGNLSSYWLPGTTNAGRVYPSQTNGPRNSWHLIMDTAQNQGSRGELTLAIDLAGEENVILSFYAKEFSDESNGPPPIPFTGHADFDGVAISEDGTTWYEVFPLRNELRSGYNHFSIDLDSAIARHGLSYNAAFQIRFNHYGTRGIPEDGIALDDISIESSVIETTLEVEPGPSPDSLRFSGFANPGSTVQLTSNLDGLIGTTTADGNGRWNLNADRLSPGTHLIIASVDGLNRTGILATAGSRPPGEPSYELIPFGSLWRYLDDGSDQYSGNTPFYSGNYYDGDWKSGNARFGYGGDGEVTTIDYGQDPSDRHMVTYFRKQFEFDADSVAEIYDKAILSLLVDDGAAVFLNGVELTRMNMYNFPLTYTLPAVDQISYDAETAGRAFEFDPSLLRDGTNVLAVGVHLYDDSSNDLGFDLRLALTRDIFSDGQVVFTDPHAEDLLMADINRDGLMDIIYLVDPSPFYPNQIVATSDDEVLAAPATVDELRCTLALPGGGFGAAVVIDQIHGVDRLRVGDLDNDGDPDLIAADREDPNNEEGIRVYRNDDGTFTLAQHLNNFLPVDMALADFNGDGYLDLVHQNMTSYGNSAFIAWRANDQSGQFGAVQNLTLERSIWSIDAGDLDGDGDMDIIAAGGTQDQVLWWRNNGSGAFSGRRISVTPSPRPRVFGLGDMDGDNDLDYVSNYGHTGWYANRGNGVLRDRRGVTMNEDSSRLNIADFDGDGDLDLAYLLDDHDLDLEWNENDGNGIFTGPRKLPFGNQAELNIKGLTAGDLDQDGKVDLLATEEGTGKFIFYRNQLGSGPPIHSFTVTDNTVPALGSTTLNWDASGASDVRLNGEPVDASGSLTVQIGNENALFRLTASNGGGTTSKLLTVFVPTPTYDSGTEITGTFDGLQNLAVGDLDQDGTEDLVFASSLADDLGWLPNDGNGIFSSPAFLEEELDGVVYPVAADFDKDGDIDIAALSLTDPLSYFENNGDGTFAAAQILSGAPKGSYLHVVDVNQDGWLDLVVSDSSGPGKIYENNWNGGWSGPHSLPSSNFAECRIVDVTGDGLPDFLERTDSSIRLFPASGVWQFPSGDVVTLTPAEPLNLQSFEVADLNGDGRLDITYLDNDSASFLLGVGDGSFVEIAGVFQSLPDHLVDSTLSDLDRDGDADLAILTNDPAGADRLFWLESDGRGAFSEPQLISETIAESHSLQAADLNLDGDLDLILAGDTITWFRNTTGSVGTPRLDSGSDTGEQDNRTSFQRPGLSGIARPGSVVTISSVLEGFEYGGSFFLGSAVADEFGSWSITAEKMPEGEHTLTIETSTGATSNLVVIIDTSTTKPEQLRLTPESDNGFSSTDGITSILTPTITGKAEAGSTVVLTSSLDGVIGNGPANDEFWITASQLTVGTHEITAVATDGAGNVSETSDPLTVTIGAAAEISLEQPANNPLGDGVSSVDFGSVGVGGSGTRVFTIRNEGGSELTGLAVSIDGANSDKFSATALGATSLQPGQTTTFSVDFSPTSTGPHSAALHLLSNDEDENPFDISLAGTGAVPEIELEQPAGNGLIDGVSSADFGEVDLSAEESLTFTIRNAGSGVLGSLSVGIDGPNASDFEASTLATTSLTSGQSTTFTVTFTPGAAGSRSATLRVGSNDIDENPFDISLNGAGINPEIMVEDSDQNPLTDGNSTIEFDDVVSSASPAEEKVITIRNTGGTPLTGLATSVTGTDAGDFSPGSLSTNTLAPGESTTVTLTFAPTTEGEKTASLRIQSNDADENPFVIALEGTKLPEVTLESWAESFSLSGASLLPTANNDRDEFTLLEEYAYNLNPRESDRDPLDPENGVSGPPLIRLVGTGDDRKLQVDFLRRADDPNLTYVVEFGDAPSDTSPNGFEAATEPESTTTIDATWTRVTITDSVSISTHSARFARVRITYASDDP